MNIKPAINPRHIPIVPTIVSWASPALLRSRFCTGRMLCVVLQHHCRVITSGLSQSWSCLMQGQRTNKKVNNKLRSLRDQCSLGQTKFTAGECSKSAIQCHYKPAVRSFTLRCPRSGPHNPAHLSFRGDFAPRYMHCHSDRAMRRFVFYPVYRFCILPQMPQMSRIRLQFEDVMFNDLVRSVGPVAAGEC